MIPPTRHNLLPMPDAEDVEPRVSQHLEALRLRTAGESFHMIFTVGMGRLISLALGSCGADEGSLWIADKEGEVLVPVFNSGPDAAKFLAEVRQPVSRGLTGMVYTIGHGCAEADVFRQRGHDPTADEKMGLHTCSLMAVPVSFLGGIRGVLTAVKVKKRAVPELPDPPPFLGAQLEICATAAGALCAMIECRMMQITLGMEAM